MMVDSARALAKLVPHIPKYKYDLPSKVIEEVKVRTLFTMQVAQKRDYFGLKKEQKSDE